MAEERVQRRPAAILAADVVGYSRLMGTDEAGTLATLKAHRTEIIDPKITKVGQSMNPRSWQDAASVIAETVETPSPVVKRVRDLIKRKN